MNIELVEGSEYRINQEADSLPSITVGLYKAFMARGKTGFDALLLYMHLLFTYRLQSDNCLHADDVYCMRGLQIGEQKLKAAKAILSRMGLIRYRQKRGARGRTERWFLELALQPNPGPRQQAQPGDPWFEDRGTEPEQISAEELEIEDDQASKKRAGSYQKITASSTRACTRSTSTPMRPGHTRKMTSS